MSAIQTAPLAGRALAYIDFLCAWGREPSFCGCAFINAAAEYPALQDPIHRLAAEHKRLIREFLERVLMEMGVAEPVLLAAH